MVRSHRTPLSLPNCVADIRPQWLQTLQLVLGVLRMALAPLVGPTLARVRALVTPLLARLPAPAVQAIEGVLAALHGLLFGPPLFVFA